MFSNYSPLPPIRFSESNFHSSLLFNSELLASKTQSRMRRKLVRVLDWKPSPSSPPSPPPPPLPFLLFLLLLLIILLLLHLLFLFLFLLLLLLLLLRSLLGCNYRRGARWSSISQGAVGTAQVFRGSLRNQGPSFSIFHSNITTHSSPMLGGSLLHLMSYRIFSSMDFLYDSAIGTIWALGGLISRTCVGREPRHCTKVIGPMVRPIRDTVCKLFNHGCTGSSPWGSFYVFPQHLWEWHSLSFGVKVSSSQVISEKVTVDYDVVVFASG